MQRAPQGQQFTSRMTRAQAKMVKPKMNFQDKQNALAAIMMASQAGASNRVSGIRTLRPLRGIWKANK